MSETCSARFITLEGGEGTGKSTLAKGIAARLEARGISVVVTREPGGTPLAEAARQLLLHPPEGQSWSALSEALLANTARRDHLEQLIRPSLAGGRWVICDRFADSTRVYQSIENGASSDALLAIEKLVLEDTLPDLTLVLDAPLEVTQARRSARGGKLDSFEKRPESFHQSVREAFLKIAENESGRCRVIDASLEASDVLELAWREVLSLMEIEGSQA